MKRFTLSHKVWSFVASAAMLLSAQGAAAQYVNLTALSGTGGTGNEGYPKLVDKEIPSKMGHSFDPANPDRADAYIILKAETPVVPKNYFLNTGNDTGSNPGRNWKTWTIYAANFEDDSLATVDAEWTVVDRRVAEPLPAKNNAYADFQFNKADGTTAYTYFYIRIDESVQGTDIWLQMSEFGLCTSKEFIESLENHTKDNELLQYRLVEGTRNDGGGESVTKLFDNDYSTKWGNGISDKPYFIVKTSRPIAPTFYKLVTGIDNATWTHRNWKTWTVYAIADPETGDPGRDDAGWVAIDVKKNVSESVLPDINCYDVYFDLSEGDTTKYSYFKVEISETQGNSYMQMSEFALGDEANKQCFVDTMVNKLSSSVDLTVMCSKDVLDKVSEVLKVVAAAGTPAEMNQARSDFNTTKQLYSESKSAYDSWLIAVTNAQNSVDGEILNAEAVEYLNKYLSDEIIAPDDNSPYGNYGYIKAYLLPSTAQIKAEANRITAYVAKNLLSQPDPIYVGYTALSGSGAPDDKQSESHESLIDGDKTGTKWCSGSERKPWWLVFKSSDPIRPSYYGLVTGSDTKSNPSRNWKTWEVYAANFESDEAATRDAEGWVLLDKRENVGTETLKAENVYENFINMQYPATVDYQYFKIELRESLGNLQQMNEFTFYNNGNLEAQREEFQIAIEDSLAACGLEIDENTLCNRDLYNQYAEALATVRDAMDAPTLIGGKNTALELIGQILTSAAKWENYVNTVEAFSPADFSEYPEVEAWAEAYKGTEEAPSAKFVNGTYAYITNNRTLTDSELAKEAERIESYVNAIYNESYIVLDGNTVGQWGDGHYKQIVDNSLDTKWGGKASADGDTYVIFRTLNAVNPYFYTLTTGGDTYTYQSRNWKTWRIFGANFEGDGAASKDAEGWVLVDEKVNVGQERLHPENLTASYFGFSTETTVPYKYYKVVVYEAYSSDAIQMQELRFGTEEEFSEIKDGYMEEANTFEYNVLCEQTLIDKYEACLQDIKNSVNMEALFRTNYEISELQKQITESVKDYEAYAAAVENMKSYLEANTLDDTEALKALTSYLNESVEPSETAFPNGSSVYVLANHLLADSVLVEETEYMESLKVAAIRGGYTAGTDVSSLIVNPSFAKAESVDGGKSATGWDGLLFSNGTNEEGTMSAAEFCEGNEVFDISQTITSLKNGYYQLKLNAGFRVAKDRLTAYNYSAMAYANDVKTYIPAVIEGMLPKSDAVNRQNCWLEGGLADKPIINEEDTTDTLGYVLWGVQSCCYAFAADRYEIPMVVKVSDGTLTFGVKNESTVTTGNWVGAGNFRLVYLGADEEDAAEAISEAVAYNAERAATLTDKYVPMDASDDSYAQAPGFAASDKEKLAGMSAQTKYDELVADGDVFQNVLDCQKAYYQLYVAKNKVYDKWINHINIERQDVLDEAVYAVVSKMENGGYDGAEGTVAAKETLYKEFPDYLEIDPSSANSATVSESGEFEYVINTEGERPFVSLKGFYENLTSDRTVLAYEYISSASITGGRMYFGTPSIDRDHMLAAAELAPAEDWTRVYIDITEAVRTWGFGNTDHLIRWDIIGDAEATLEIYARNFIVITADEAPDAIDSISTSDVEGTDAIYNLSGQRVGKASKGILIINGKKYLVK